MTAITARFSNAVALGVCLIALDAGGADAQERRSVAGRVLAARDSVPLVGVTARVVEFGMTARTDQSGRFILRDVPRFAARIAFERLGLVADTIPLPPNRDTLVVYLASSALRMAPITAEAPPPARQRFDELAQLSTISLEPAEITGTPAILEADVTRVIQLLPGTVAKNDFTTGFNVRGGEADQNLITLDGVTVFNPSHLGGLFSTFDAFAIQQVDFITGAFPAGYGGRLSSILDIQLRDGNAERTAVRGQLSLLSAKVLVDGPIGDRVTYMLGGRRTYADAIVGAVSDETLPYYFGDLLGKVATRVGGGQLTVTGYLGRDVLDWPWVDAEDGRDAVDIEFNWGNRLLGVRFEKPFGRHVLEVHASGTGFSTGLGLEPDVVRVENTVGMWAGGWSLALSTGVSNSLRIGAGVEDYKMTYDIRSTALGANFFSATYQPRIWSAFVDDQWHPVGWLMIRPGIRLESIEGPGFTAFAPRVGVKAFLDSDFALTGSAGRYYQAIHSLRDQEIPFAVFDFWIGADSVTPVARSDHLVFGFEKWFRSDYSISLEGYRKTFHNLVSRNREEDFKVHGDEFIPTDGDAWGLDLLARKYRGKVRGWVAYSFVDTERRTDVEVFAPAHDRRHTLNVVLQTDGPLGSDMGVRWGFGSPLPYTGFIGEWRHRQYSAIEHAFEDFEEEPLAAATRNGERYPSYNRLDLSFRWSVNKWGGVLHPYFQVVNAYNRGNTFLFLFDYADRPATRTAISQFPILPSFGVEFEF